MKRDSIKYILAALMLMLPFQNCTSQKSMSSGPSTAGIKLDHSTSGGNGEYYGGKLTAGTYVRPLPELKCGSEKYLATIAVNDNGTAAGRILDPDTCRATDVELHTDQLEYASYEQGRFGLNEGIYSMEAESNSDKLVDETWCRSEGSTTRTGFDIVVKADYQKKTFTTIVVASKYVNGAYEKTTYNSPTPRRDIEMGRRVRYRSDQFELDIDTGTYDVATGKMRAEFEFGFGGADIDRNLNCRLGGELDLQYVNKPYDFAQIISLDKFKSIAKQIGSFLQIL